MTRWSDSLAGSGRANHGPAATVLAGAGIAMQILRNRAIGAGARVGGEEWKAEPAEREAGARAGPRRKCVRRDRASQKSMETESEPNSSRGAPGTHIVGVARRFTSLSKRFFTAAAASKWSTASPSVMDFR